MPAAQLGGGEVCVHLFPEAGALAFIGRSQPHSLALSGVPALPGEHLSISSSEVDRGSVHRETSLSLNVVQQLAQAQALPASKMA